MNMYGAYPLSVDSYMYMYEQLVYLITIYHSRNQFGHFENDQHLNSSFLMYPPQSPPFLEKGGYLPPKDEKNILKYTYGWLSQTGDIFIFF